MIHSKACQIVTNVETGKLPFQDSAIEKIGGLKTSLKVVTTVRKHLLTVVSLPTPSFFVTDYLKESRESSKDRVT